MTAFLGVVGGLLRPSFSVGARDIVDMISILPTEDWLSREDGIPNWFSPAERSLPTSGRLNGQSFDFQATPEFPLSTPSRIPHDRPPSTHCSHSLLVTATTVGCPTADLCADR
jgi:hypothetical protein